MEKKTVLGTGATDGIGKETALHLARKHEKVLIHGRNRGKGLQVLAQIKSETRKENAALYVADFSSLADVKRMAEDIKREQSELHVLVNNAGNFYKERMISADGFEMTLAVNHLAPFLLTLLLLDLIKQSAPARIVNVSSSAHKSIRDVDLDYLQSENGYDPFTTYGISKLGNVLFTKTLAEKLIGTEVTVNSLHPGVVATKLLRKSYNLAGISPAEGAQTSIFLTSSPGVKGVSGKHFQNLQERNTSVIAEDKDLQATFCKISMEMVNNFLDKKPARRRVN